MAWGRKSARIAELTAALEEASEAMRAAGASVENITASRDAQTRYAAEKVVEIERLNAETALLVRVGDRMARKLGDPAAEEWDAAKIGEAWRDERGRFITRSQR